MRPNKPNPLSEEFLKELYATAIQNDNICSAIAQYMEPDFLPNREWQQINKYLKINYAKYSTAPTQAILCQSLTGEPDAYEIAKNFNDIHLSRNTDVVLDLLEQYIKTVKLQKIYINVGKLYNQQKSDDAIKTIQEYAEWVSGFTLKASAFVNVNKTFVQRFMQNRKNEDETNKLKLTPVNRFYINELDELNGGRNLRGQLSCLMASTGVGKSHIARHIGVHASTNGLNVLHFQLEGSEGEALNAYSGALVCKSSYLYEKGKISDTEMRIVSEQVLNSAGNISLRTYARFNNKVSTIDIKNGIAEYRKINGFNPDVVIVDSMDLLNDSSGRIWDANHERGKRIAVANDLKDLAGDENIWVVATYQSTIENREWQNDEKNVLTEFNCSEAKGLSRPLTHLITLNRSDAERKEEKLRLHVAKSRFFTSGDTFTIVTDYGNEVFYDAARTAYLSSHQK